MTEKTKRRKLGVKILQLITFLAYFALGVGIIVYICTGATLSHVTFGVILMCNALPLILLTILEKKGNMKRKIALVVISSLIVIAGIIVTCVSNFPTTALFIMWGALDIIQGLMEIATAYKNMNQYKRKAVAQFVIGFAEIVFGILLCIQQLGGVKVHLIFLVVTSFLCAADVLLDFIILCKETKRS